MPEIAIGMKLNSLGPEDVRESDRPNRGRKDSYSDSYSDSYDSYDDEERRSRRSRRSRRNRSRNSYDLDVTADQLSGQKRKQSKDRAKR